MPGAILRTQQGCGTFSWNRLTALLPFRYGYTAVAGESTTLLSGFSDATAEVMLRHGSATVEARTENSLCAVGLRVGLTEWELNRLHIALPNTELREQHIVNRFYSMGFSVALPARRLRYDGDRYWGRLSLGLHDFGPFIAQPAVNAVASIHRFRLTK